MKAPWLKNLLIPAVHRVTNIAKRISRSASFSRPSSSVMLAVLSYYAVDSPCPRLLCARANPSADRDPVATFMLATWIWTAWRKRAKRYGRRSAHQRHAPQFCSDRPRGGGQSNHHPLKLGPQQKCEKYRRLPTNMEIPQVSSVLVIDFDFPKEWLFGRSS